MFTFPSAAVGREYPSDIGSQRDPLQPASNAFGNNEQPCTSNLMPQALS